MIAFDCKLPRDMDLEFIPSMERIIINYYQLDPMIFWNRPKYRKREYVWARQLLMYLQRNCTVQSLSDIGKRYSKDHTTVLHGEKNVINICETEKDTFKRFEEIYNEIYKAYINFIFENHNNYVCFKCGNYNGLMVLSWVNPNNNAILENIIGNSPGICEKCGETIIVMETEYQEYYHGNTMETLPGRM